MGEKISYKATARHKLKHMKPDIRKMERDLLELNYKVEILWKERGKRNT